LVWPMESRRCVSGLSLLEWVLVAQAQSSRGAQCHPHYQHDGHFTRPNRPGSIPTIPSHAGIHYDAHQVFPLHTARLSSEPTLALRREALDPTDQPAVCGLFAAVHHSQQQRHHCHRRCCQLPRQPATTARCASAKAEAVSRLSGVWQSRMHTSIHPLTRPPFTPPADPVPNVLSTSSSIHGPITIVDNQDPLSLGVLHCRFVATARTRSYDAHYTCSLDQVVVAALFANRQREPKHPSHS
jgi:hypothetical protein